MEKIDIIEVKESLVLDNDKDACDLRNELKSNKVALLNLMSSPGSGKSSTLLSLNKYFKDQIKWGVMEADIDGDVDAKTLLFNGIPAIQIHTGGMCHLDAAMTRQGLEYLKYKNFDFIVLENVGNLVCPAEFDTGANINMTILSIPEGDDKPLKYPLIYEKSDIVVINKIDAIDYFDFKKEKVEIALKRCNPNIKIFYISAKTGVGVKELANYILKLIREWIR